MTDSSISRWSLDPFRASVFRPDPSGNPSHPTARCEDEWVGRGDMDKSMEEIDDGETLWRFESSFLRSNWTCIWGRGCQGILAEPAEHLGHGCCSIGADLDGEDEARRISALAATPEPSRFEHHAEARTASSATTATPVRASSMVPAFS